MSEFLDYVLAKISLYSVKEVLYLANLVWEEFVPVQDLAYSEEEIIGFADNLISKYLEDMD